MSRAPGPNANRHRRQNPIRITAVVAVVLVFTGLLAGCRSAPDNPRLDWVPTARCPDPSTVGASSELGSVHFTVTTAKSETLRSTGCSYRDSVDGIRVDATIEPGPPSDVQFGTAAGIVDSKKPALGNGAHLGISPTYCSVAVPKNAQRNNSTGDHRWSRSVEGRSTRVREARETAQ